jgi:hypothetical protein
MTRSERACGSQNSASGPDLGFYAARSYSLMRPPSTGWRWERSATGWPGPGWAELSAAMGSPAAVMGLMLGQDRPQMPFAEVEHPLGDLGPAVSTNRSAKRSRVGCGRVLHNLHIGIGQDRVKRCGELPGPVTDQEPEVRPGYLPELPGPGDDQE